MTTPSTQKHRPIGLMLYDRSAGSVIAHQDFVVRPEELTRNEPARIMVHQTLGGAWGDDFGEGLRTIQLQGHTGWHGNSIHDGAALYQRLHSQIWRQWFTLRQRRVEHGRDPTAIEMLFNDELDQISAVVVPQQFQLRRSRTRPLLFQFHIELTELADARLSSPPPYDPIYDATQNPRARQTAALEALAQTIKRQEAISKQSNSVLGSNAGVTGTMAATSASILGKVATLAAETTTSVTSALAPALAVASSVERSCWHAYQLIASSVSGVSLALQAASAVAALYHDAVCTLLNGFDLLRRIFDPSGLFGASSCSSTGGGLPGSVWADVNPFYSMYSPVSAPVIVSPNAAKAMEDLSADPLSLPSSFDVGSRLKAIADGVTAQ